MSEESLQVDPGVEGARLGLQAEPGVEGARLGLQAEPGAEGARLGLKAEPGVEGARLGLQAEPGAEGAKLGLQAEPGEGFRLRALKESLNNTVDRLLGSWKASLFAKCFPTLANKNEAVLEALRAFVVEAVRKALYEELIDVIEEEIAKPLEELGSLVKNHSGAKNVKAWRPSGDPLLDMIAHDVKVLKYEKRRLVEAVEAAKTTTEGLLQKVVSGRKNCHSNQLAIKSVLSPLNELYALSSELPEANMRSHFCEIMDKHH